MYGLTVVTPPAEEPVSTEAAKAHLRVEHNVDDPYIAALVTSARELVELRCSKALCTQTLRLHLDEFPDVIRLPRSPVQSVTEVRYVDTAGAEQVLDPSLYRVDTASREPRITPAYGQAWPATRPVTHAVTVRFVAGYGDPAAVPKALVQAMLLLVGTYYDSVRQTVIVGTNATELPQAAKSLMGLFRVPEVGG
jgi:uncharacterized phiE125 gp8 family phage protein